MSSNYTNHNTTSAVENVGIVAMEAYFPYQYVSQQELEQYDGVSAGKYTIGLGQSNMSFVADNEDVASIAMTVTRSLLSKYNIPYQAIGRLEIGTESLIDKSKSVKTSVMALFQQHNVTDLEGVDNMNACYGGTAALFNSVDWIYSPNWNKRFALVIAADIAVYDAGSARPTGGCGAVAMLLGTNAALVLDTGLRGVFMENSWDFYKPILNSEYPVVDGHYSIVCYMKALDYCYQRYKQKYKRKYGRSFSVASSVDKNNNSNNDNDNNNDMSTDSDRDSFFLFHSPYCKLVQKALARLVYNDFRDNPSKFLEKFPQLSAFQNMDVEKSYFSRELEQAFVAQSSDPFSRFTAPSLYLSKNVGNIYCGSLYLCLLSLLQARDQQLVGKQILLFSYGSGSSSCMFSISVRSPSPSPHTISYDEEDPVNYRSSNTNTNINNDKQAHSISVGPWDVKEISEKIDIENRINSRKKVSPKEFVEALTVRAASHSLKPPYTPSADQSVLFPGTYYLDNIDDKYRRHYKLKE